jgi:hypothetical protein
MPTLALHEKNGDSAGNYHLFDEESTGGMVIPPGIACSWTRNPAEEFLFHWELTAQGQGILRRNGIPPGMIST